MNSNDISKNVVPYAVGAVIGIGALLAYRKWRASKIVMIPPATPEEAQVIEANRGSFVMDAEAHEMLTRQPDPELERMLDEEEAIARRGLMALRPVEKQTVVVNLFNNPDNTWDLEAELNTRDPELPYIISYDEYLADDMDYTQDTVTYYARDGMMADGLDHPIYDYSDRMGHLRFGHGSNDANVVYIRNEKLQCEWEVLLHTSSFAEEILGQEMEAASDNELRHSVPRFRGE